MTLETTAAAVARLPRHPLWAIGSHATADRETDLLVSHDDLARDVAFVRGALADHGMQRGHVLVVSGGWEAPWYWPFAAAAIEVGGRYSATEIWPFDARRTGLFLRRLSIDAVVGIDAAVIAGLAQLHDLADLFRDVRVVLARPDALAPLAAVGVAAHAVAAVGPAIAIEGPERDGLRFDETSWSFTAADWRLHVSTVGVRAHQVSNLALDMRGEVLPAADGAGMRLRLEHSEDDR